MTVTVRAYAKLNLYLDITGIMPNGYHYLDNLTQSVSIYDDVTVRAEKSDSFRCKIACTDSRIPCDEKNIAFKAAKVFLDKTGITSDIEIAIAKNIPLMGGMGGSSVDGAAVLAALNRIFDYPLTQNKLYKIGMSIGADVPICIKGGTILSKGDGINMKSIIPKDSCSIVCVQPDFTLSTAKAYALYDSKPTPAKNNLQNVSDEIAEKGFTALSDKLYNIFTVLYENKDIDNLITSIKTLGAHAAEMTGSGSVVYGIFNSTEKAQSAAQQLKDKYNDVFLCEPVSSGVLFIG